MGRPLPRPPSKPHNSPQPRDQNDKPTRAVDVRGGRYGDGLRDKVQVDAACRYLKIEDALEYLELVKSHYSSNPVVYNQFLDIMREFKAGTIHTPEVMRRVIALFEGKQDLLLGFNAFLPPGYNIDLNGNLERDA